VQRLRKSQGAAGRLTGQAGAVDFYQGSHRELFPDRELTPQAFSLQISDCLPLWLKVTGE